MEWVLAGAKKKKKKRDEYDRYKKGITAYTLTAQKKMSLPVLRRPCKWVTVE